MARFQSKNKWNPIVSFDLFPDLLFGVVRKKKSYLWPEVYSPEVTNEGKRGVLELADGFRMLAKHVAKTTGRGLPKRGVPTDPNEGTNNGSPGFVLPVFPRDPDRYRIVVRTDEHGLVEANIPVMKFDDDIAGMIQAATVLEQCAALMKAYEGV